MRPRTNRLEIKVTSLWPNHIIGDQLRSAQKQKKYTFTHYKPYTKDSPLVGSGLLGSDLVTLSAMTWKEVRKSVRWVPV